MTRADQAGLTVQDIARSSEKRYNLDAKTPTVSRRSKGARKAAMARRSKPSKGKPW